MNKYDYYEELKFQLLGRGFDVENYQEINYGLQFKINYQGKSELVRIFESKKKGTRLDLSTVKDEEIKKLLSQVEVEGNSGAGGDPGLSLPQTLQVIGKDLQGEVQELIEQAGGEREDPSQKYITAAYKLNGAKISIFTSGKILFQGQPSDRLAKLHRKIEELIQAVFTADSAENESETASESQTGAGLIGVDESGKGDYFGPLVIAGVYVDSELERELRQLGITDSKRLRDNRIDEMALQIQRKCYYSIVTIGNTKYNQLYESFGNLNRMLAWGHARVIENMLEKVDCSFALSDQFGKKELIEQALLENGRRITLEQRPRAESNVAVAAASILARAEFVAQMDELSRQYELELPKGANNHIISSGREFVRKHGQVALREVAKLHFKTTQKILT